MQDDFVPPPIDIAILRAFRRVNDHLRETYGIGEAIERDRIEGWAAHVHGLNATNQEVEAFCAWYIRHYRVPLGLGVFYQGILYLREYGSLPPHRLTTLIESRALKLIQTLIDEGVDQHSAEAALGLAAGLLAVPRLQRFYSTPEAVRTYSGYAYLNGQEAVEVLHDIDARPSDFGQIADYLLRR